MKSIYLTLAVLTVLLSSISAFGQDFDVPKNYKLITKEDYAPYEQDIIKAAKWLKETPFDAQKGKRKEVSRFVIRWINGSPTVNVELNEHIMNFDKKNEGMLALFMASCARYVLENDYSTDMRAKHKYALRAMMDVYKEGKGIDKDKKMDRLIRSDEEGKLDEWIATYFKILPR